MAISRMQEPRQLMNNGGILTVEAAKKMAPPGESLAYINKDEAKLLKSLGGAGEDINGTGIKSYFIKKAFKKAKRAVKKIVKSPIGKMALLGGLGWAANAGHLGGLGTGWWGKFGKTGIGSLLKKGATGAGNWWGGLSGGQKLFTGLGAAAIAAPFLMGGDEEEEVQEDWTQTPSSIANIRAQAIDHYRNPGASTLAFMPGKQYVQPNYYLAEGGRVGLLNGGGAGEEQIEQMLMAEFIKYKNQGGQLTFEQFVQAIMQAQQEGEGMEQPQEVAMAADGGRMGFKDGKSWWDNFKSGWSQVLGGETEAFLSGDQKKINEILTGQGWGIDLKPETIKMIIDGHKKGLDISTISSLAETDEGTVANIIEKLSFANGGPVPGSTVSGYTTPAAYNRFDYPSGGDPVRVGAFNGGLMKEDEDEYAYNPQAAMRMYQRPGKQEGGIMETEVAEEMIDLGGKEKDYRETGGFVELGRKERADDVPARLSKNEFVFTADAVRAAGGGDIDKGSEVMQNLMDNLEAGGEVSEESQGLEGAQAMYDQQQMLQSRMI